MYSIALVKEQADKVKQEIYTQQSTMETSECQNQETQNTENNDTKNA